MEYEIIWLTSVPMQIILSIDHGHGHLKVEGEGMYLRLIWKIFLRPFSWFLISVLNQRGVEVRFWSLPPFSEIMLLVLYPELLTLLSFSGICLRGEKNFILPGKIQKITFIVGQMPLFPIGLVHELWGESEQLHWVLDKTWKPRRRGTNNTVSIDSLRVRPEMLLL